MRRNALVFCKLWKKFLQAGRCKESTWYSLLNYLTHSRRVGEQVGKTDTRARERRKDGGTDVS